MNDADFEKRLPLGMPLFEETSAVVARKHTINPQFTAEITALTEKYELGIPQHRPTYERNAFQIYQRYLTAGNLVSGMESETDFQKRLEYEIVSSKQIIETRMEKPVRFLCWPHGDNSHQAHALARKAGYAATTAGKLTGEIDKPDRIPRIGTDWNIGSWWMHRKLDYKLSSHHQKQP